VIGLLGGTFDPVHIGHLRTGLEVFQQCGLDELRWMPAGQPPHRPTPVAPAAHRLAMLERAIAGVPGFRVDARELRREGPSFTVTSLRELRRELGPECPLVLIVGADACSALHRWHRAEELPGLAHLVVMDRPGATDRERHQGIAGWRMVADSSALRAEPAGCVQRIAVTGLAISATAIREGLRAGRSPRFLVPDAVLDYIERHPIYPGPERAVTAGGPSIDRTPGSEHAG
jgi:nicotinate-nucleotide adenylyltransferase